MPLYEFSFVDAEGATQHFEDFMSYDDLQKGIAESTLRSPCGEFAATRMLSMPAIGAEGPTNAEKTAFVHGKKSLSERRELSGHVKNQRDERKKASDPNTQAGFSNEYWTQGSSTKGIVSRVPGE
jgi:hypothetical protein